MPVSQDFPSQVIIHSLDVPLREITFDADRRRLHHNRDSSDLHLPPSEEGGGLLLDTSCRRELLSDHFGYLHKEWIKSRFNNVEDSAERSDDERARELTADDDRFMQQGPHDHHAKKNVAERRRIE